MKKMKRAILLAILLSLFVPGTASAMRIGIGASQVSRIDIGAAQESKDQAAINKWWWRRRNSRAEPSRTPQSRPAVTERLYSGAGRLPACLRHAEDG